MKISSIVTLTFISQCLSESAVDVCVKERKCDSLDLECLLGCLNDNNIKPSNQGDKFECVKECSNSIFTQCEAICNSDDYKGFDNNHKKNSSNRASIMSPLLYAAFSLSMLYCLV